MTPRWLVAAVGLLLLFSCKPKASPDASGEVLELRNRGAVLATPTLRELVDRFGTENVTMKDPYYAREKTFVAVSLEKVLAYYFGENVSNDDYLFRARDGYAVPMSAQRVNEGGAYLAIRDVGGPWEPIGPQRASPAPLYLVWIHPHQQDLETHPRPWQLASIERTQVEIIYPHASPKGAGEDSPAYRGFRTFKDQCVSCHAINRDGGRVGPELNVPQSIVEYRPEAQIRAYIRNPRTFRYSAMPPHPMLSEQNLDELLAYFSTMKDQKFDPEGVHDAH